MRSIGKAIGGTLWIGSGLLLFFYWFLAMGHWLGLIGSILAFLVAPGVVIFPIVFWIVEGIFPTTYFVYWGIGLVGMIISGISSAGE